MQPGPAENRLLYEPKLEGEGYDRTSLRLPGRQLTLAQALAVQTKTPLAAVLLHGGPVDVQWLQESDRFSAILTCFYPGQVQPYSSAAVLCAHAYAHGLRQTR